MKSSAAVLCVSALCSVANAFTYTVTVGIDETTGHQGIGFDPSSIRPAPGDTVTFTYALPEYLKDPPPVQHSATQSTFDNPCTPMPGGFDTGVQSTGSVNSNTGQSFNLLINDTNPLWFFSSVGSDCKSGMVLSINPPLSGDQTDAAFRAKAAAFSGTPAAAPSAPGAQAGSPTSTSSSVAPASPTATAPPPPSASTQSGAGYRASVELGLAAIVALIGVTMLAV